MADQVYPACIYFVQRENEYLTFVGHLCKLAALGYSLGVDAMLVTDKPPANSPPAFSCPGVWVEYSDKSFQSVGSLY